MHKAVKKFFDENQAALAGDADVVMAFGLIASQNALVEGLIQAQNLDRVGVTSAKKIARDIMEERALIIAGRLSGWAYYHQNPVLQAEMNFTKGGQTASKGIGRYPDAEVAPVCRTILQRAQENQASIPALTPLELSAFEGFIATYENLLSAPTTAAGQASAATELMEPTLDRTDEMLRMGLDRFMLTFGHSNPALHIQYKEARKIIDAGIRHEPPPAPPAPTP